MNAFDLIKRFEGFRTTPYWDVNAYRTGYGSDTVTLADGARLRAPLLVGADGLRPRDDHTRGRSRGHDGRRRDREPGSFAPTVALGGFDGPKARSHCA